MNQQPSSSQESVPSIVPIDPQALIEKCESPTILAIAILISILIGSITGLVQVIMLTKPSR